jgi:RND family efflux transporter MFP subunit
MTISPCSRLLAILTVLLLATASLTHAQTPAPVQDGTTAAVTLAPAAQAEPARKLARLHPRSETWPEVIEARGNIMPWQETLIGTEVGGLRLLSVEVNVGDVVKKGQVLARLNPTTVEVELEAANAHLVEAEAGLAQATATLERANRLAPGGGVSQQELTLYQTQKHTAEARLNASRAQVRTQQLRLDFATLVAPDDGIISSRAAAEGAIVQAGSELFRLIRQGRLEWRAEVRGETLLKLAPEQEAMVRSPLGPAVHGRVRQVSPTIDLKTGNGLVYVDLPPDTNLKAGLHVGGTLTMGQRKVLTLPVTALLRQPGSTRVLKVDGEDRIEAIVVRTGSERDGRVEIVAGIDEHSELVAAPSEQLLAETRPALPDPAPPNAAPTKPNPVNPSPAATVDGGAGQSGH